MTPFHIILFFYALSQVLDGLWLYGKYLANYWISMDKHIAFPLIFQQLFTIHNLAQHLSMDNCSVRVFHIIVTALLEYLNLCSRFPVVFMTVLSVFVKLCNIIMLISNSWILTLQNSPHFTVCFTITKV